MNTYSSKSNASRAARSALGDEAIEGMDFAVTGSGKSWTWAEVSQGAPAPKAQVMLATEAGDLGLVEAEGAKARAEEEARKMGVPVFIRDAMSDEVLDTVTAPAKVKGKAAKAPKEPKEPKAAAPSGMVAKIIELAVRPEGVTPQELNALTNWKGAPWKWLFSNPKKTGYADRWGYEFEAAKDGKKAIYFLRAPEERQAA